MPQVPAFGDERVYPRVCGGTHPPHPPHPGIRGLSPRMRGNRRQMERRRLEQRSIPAYAGEPPRRKAPRTRYEVYPRVCGGTAQSQRGGILAYGLSPRMRGNRGPGGRWAGWGGSIPAYAGEPGRTTTSAPTGRVYPRVCGGTGQNAAPILRGNGLSPRMRGNPEAPANAVQPDRSIPAYAGEPHSWAVIPAGAAVYPRVCGGTRARLAASMPN